MIAIATTDAGLVGLEEREEITPGFMPVTEEEEAALMARDDIAMWSYAEVYGEYLLCGITEANGWGRAGQNWVSISSDAITESDPDAALVKPDNRRSFVGDCMRAILPVVRKPIQICVFNHLIPWMEEQDRYMVGVCQSPHIGAEYSGVKRYTAGGRPVLLTKGGVLITDPKPSDGGLIYHADDWRELARTIQDAQSEQITTRPIGDVCASAFRRALNETQQVLSSKQQALARLEREYSEVLSGIKALQRRKEQLNEVISGARPLDLPKIPGIRFVSAISDEDLIIQTDPIPLQYVHDGSIYTHDLGEFVIRLNVSTMALSCYNITRRIRSFGSAAMSAPHAWDDGRVCLGNASYLLTEAMMQLDLGSALSLVISFLQSANLNDGAGVGAVVWPLSGVSTMTPEEAAAAEERYGSDDDAPPMPDEDDEEEEE